MIAPSRFGYLGSARPPGATPADQADAVAALLGQLAITSCDVIAFSAGATSALQLAPRYPGRVQHLMVISGNWPGGRTADHQPQANRLLVRSELPMWAVATFARPVVARLLGVPNGLPLTAADTRTVTGLIDSIFPVVPRAAGVIFDFFVSNPDINTYDLVTVTVPTLIVHARDDPLICYDTARRAAARIPGARLVSADRGGHPCSGSRKPSSPNSLPSWRTSPDIHLPGTGSPAAAGGPPGGHYGVHDGACQRHKLVHSRGLKCAPHPGFHAGGGPADAYQRERACDSPDPQPAGSVVASSAAL